MLGRMPPPLPQSMARDWQLGHSQTFAEYSQEEQDALSWAQHSTMCALCCSAPKGWVNFPWRYIPYQFVKVFCCCLMDSDVQYKYLCKETCIKYGLEPETDAYEVVVSNDWVSNMLATAGERFVGHGLGGKPDLTIPGPEAKRLIGYMLNEYKHGGSSAEGYYPPKHEHAIELQNLWLILRDVVSETPEKAKEFERLQIVLKKMLQSDASWGRFGLNTVISSYYKTGPEAFGDTKISIDGADFKDAGKAISGIVADIIKRQGDRARDVLFDPNEESFLKDVMNYLKYKQKVGANKMSISKEGDPERALKFVESRVGDKGDRIWAMLYSLAIAKAAQSQSPVVVIRKCIKGSDGKYLPKYGPGQDFEMDFLERRRNLDEVRALFCASPPPPFPPGPPPSRFCSLLASFDVTFVSGLCICRVQAVLSLDECVSVECIRCWPASLP